MKTPWNETPQRRRVRLMDVRFERSADMRSEAEVLLEWEAVEYRGQAKGVGQGTIDLRVCAEATLEALRALLGERASFRLVGVKSVRAFDDALAIVSLSAHDPEREEDRRLIGAAVAKEGDLPRGVAMAVLNATNRLLGNFLIRGN